MTREFKYRPQYLLFLLGLAGLIGSFKLLPAIIYGEVGFAFLMGFFGLTSLILAIVFLTLFARHLGSENLIITDDKIEIPGRWSKRSILSLDKVSLIGTIDSWDKVIKISDGQQIHSIDGKLMSNVDLQELKTILQNRIK